MAEWLSGWVVAQVTEFTDYCPETFALMRHAAGINTADYATSMASTGKEQFSEGASGAFLYFKDSQK